MTRNEHPAPEHKEMSDRLDAMHEDRRVLVALLLEACTFEGVAPSFVARVRAALGGRVEAR